MRIQKIMSYLLLCSLTTTPLTSLKSVNIPDGWLYGSIAVLGLGGLAGGSLLCNKVAKNSEQKGIEKGKAEERKAIEEDEKALHMAHALMQKLNKNYGEVINVIEKNPDNKDVVLDHMAQHQYRSKLSQVIQDKQETQYCKHQLDAKLATEHIKPQAREEVKKCSEAFQICINHFNLIENLASQQKYYLEFYQLHDILSKKFASEISLDQAWRNGTISRDQYEQAVLKNIKVHAQQPTYVAAEQVTRHDSQALINAWNNFINSNPQSSQYNDFKQKAWADVAALSEIEKIVQTSELCREDFQKEREDKNKQLELQKLDEKNKIASDRRNAELKTAAELNHKNQLEENRQHQEKLRLTLENYFEPEREKFNKQIAESNKQIKQYQSRLQEKQDEVYALKQEIAQNRLSLEQKQRLSQLLEQKSRELEAIKQQLNQEQKKREEYQKEFQKIKDEKAKALSLIINLQKIVTSQQMPVNRQLDKDELIKEYNKILNNFIKEVIVSLGGKEEQTISSQSEHNEEEALECSICLEAIDKNNPGFTTNCHQVDVDNGQVTKGHHIFHKACLQKAFAASGHHRCPLCNGNVENL